MPASSISWTDDAGSASLSNGKAVPGTRFADWVVRKKPVGPRVVGAGTGLIHLFEFRADTTVSFQIVGVPESEMEAMVRLQDHLLNGGTVTLAGDRELAATFSTCALAPDSEPTIEQSDPPIREYTMSLALLAVS